MELRPAMLELANARVVRDGHTILSVDRLVVADGERLAVLGPNGSGKSTLIGLLTREIRPVAPAAGEPAPVLLFGRERWSLAEARSLLGVVSFDLQETYDVPVTVLDTVVSGYFGSIGLYRHHRVEPGMIAHAHKLLGELGIDGLAARTMDTLSTGEARRALIARALVHEPRVLVLDEPCAGLDPGAAYHVRRSVSDLARAGRALVLVTHHVDDIVPEIDRAVLLRDGGVLRDGPVADVLTSEALSELFGVPTRIEERGGWRRMW